MRRLRTLRLARDEAGQEIVEFALASVLFFATMFGILEFGQAIWRYNFIANLAQAGARRATVCGTAKALSSSDCNIQNYVTNQSLGMVSSGNVTTSPIDISTLVAGANVSVTVTTSFTPLTTLIPHAALNLSATTQMIMAR